MSNRRRTPFIFCLAALAAIAAGCSPSTPAHTAQTPVLTPEARQAMRRDMTGPGAPAPVQPQSGAAGN
ncbi:MAG: hypothetical protein ACRYFS_05415 [Janthinobacterium lividum]